MADPVSGGRDLQWKGRGLKGTSAALIGHSRFICMPVFPNLPPPTPANTDPKPPIKGPFLTPHHPPIPPQSLLLHQNLPSGTD